jgi:hypothetical protein
MSEKQTGRRRRHRSRAEADQIAAEYEASGLSREEFCQQKSVAMKTLARYVTRVRKQSAARSEPQRWVSIEVGGRNTETGSELTVVLGCGRRIEIRRGFDAGTLRELVTALEGIC